MVEILAAANVMTAWLLYWHMEQALSIAMMVCTLLLSGCHNQCTVIDSRLIVVTSHTLLRQLQTGGCLWHHLGDASKVALMYEWAAVTHFSLMAFATKLTSALTTPATTTASCTKPQAVQLPPILTSLSMNFTC